MAENLAEVLEEEPQDISKKAKPFLKWAGGKGRLLPELLSRAPEKFGTYFEPFLGGGALFFALQPEHAVLSDSNSDLINCYEVVRNQPEELIAELSNYKYDEEQYYEVRGLDRKEDFNSLPPLRRAARTIYLNKTCYNGLYRVNRKGQFNTPFGKYTNPTIADKENLLACSAALKERTLRVGSFLDILSTVSKEDFVYFDPPYLPLSDSSDFTSYTQESFSWGDQEMLQAVCIKLREKGVRFMLSNACHPKIEALYSDFTIEKVQAPRAINSKGTKRGAVYEFIISNYR